MEREEVGQFLSMAEGLLGQAMRLHDFAIRIVIGQQTPQYRVNALFARTLDQPAETLLQPYRTVQPGIAFGFEDAPACSAILREFPREGGYNKVRVELRALGQSRWFSMEVDLPWPAIRPADYLDLTIAAAGSQELGCTATLTAFDLDGGRHDLGAANLWIPAIAGTAHVSVGYSLPETTRLNFDVEPKLILFFPTEPFTVDLDYIEMSAR